jgi:protease II
MHRRSLAALSLGLFAACAPDKPAVTVIAPPVSQVPSATAPDRPAPAASAAPAAEKAYSGHGAESIPPELIAKYAPPSLPSELSRKIQSMLDIRAPSSGVLSPDGKRLFFTWAVTGVSHVWRVDGPQRFPVQMTGGEDATGIAAVSPDGKFIVVSRDRKGEEYPGLYVQSADGGPLTVLQHKPKVQTILGFVADDAKSIVFRANDKKPDAYALYRYDLATKKAELLFDEDGLWTIDDHRPDGRMLLAKHTGGASQEYFELEPKTKKLTPLFGQGEKEEYEARYARDPNEILVLTRKLSDFARLYRWQAGKFTVVTPEMPHDVEAFRIDRAREHLFYETNDGGFTRLAALDAKAYKETKIPAFPGADHVIIASVTDDGKYAVLSVGTSKAPPQSHVYDWGTGRLMQWHLPSAPEIETSRFATVTLESYPARDGTKVPMFVRRPEGCDKAADPCPVIVTFHGGPEAQARPGFSTRAQIFVDAGFVYVEPNVRGSEGYGKTWVHADDGPKRLAVITDIEDASKFIRANWAKNGKAPKVGILGGSYGGYSTLVGMTMFAGAYDAGASIVGISSLITFLENTAPYRRALRASEYGDLATDREALAKLSPITYIDKVKAPLLVLQGANDPRVPVGEALQIHDALEARHVPNGLIIFADEGHGSQRRENRVLEIGHVLQFFQTHLKH